MRYETTLFNIALSVALAVIFWITTPASQTPVPPVHYEKQLLDAPQYSVHTPNLVDVTIETGIQRPHTQRSEYVTGLHESLGAGACAFDYDNDGWIDLLLMNGSGTTHFYGKPQWWQQGGNSLSLYRNNQHGGFDVVTQESGLHSSAWSMGCAHGDLDNDGDSDLFLSHYGANQLWRNNGDGTFTDVTPSTNITGELWSTSANIIDVNGDGWLDIYVNNFIDFTTNSLTFEANSGYEASLPKNFDARLYNPQANQLFINEGNLHFTDQAELWGVDNPQGRSLSALWTDLNDDRLIDVIIANGQGSSNHVLLNNKDKPLTDITTASGLGFADSISAIALADINNDSQAEFLFATDHQLFPKLYRRASIQAATLPIPSFEDIADNYGLQHATRAGESHWGILFTDINMDGWADAVLANGLHAPNQNAPLIPRGQNNTLLMNQAGQQWINHSEKLAPYTLSSDASRCVLSADFSNNGAPDLYISNNNSLGQLLHNTLEEHRWLGVDLRSQGQAVNGSRVRLTAQGAWGKKTLRQHYGGSQGFLCQGDPRMLFSLALFPKDSQLSLEIIWPDDSQQTIDIDKTERYYRVHHPASNTQKNEIKQKKLASPQTTSSNFLPTPSILKKSKHQLQWISWLIEQKDFSSASHALRVFVKRHENNKDFRLDAFRLSTTLPRNMADTMLPLAIKDVSPDINIWAIKRIKDTENENFHRYLLKLLAHNNTDVVCAVTQAYGHFFDEEEAFIVHQYTSLSDLIRLAEQTDDKKQVCAINALGKSEHYRAVIPLIALANHKHDNVRLAAVDALGLLKEKSAIRELISRFQDHKESGALRGEALIAIKQIDPSFDISTLINKQLSDSHKKTVIPAIYHARYLSDKRIIISDALEEFDELLIGFTESSSRSGSGSTSTSNDDRIEKPLEPFKTAPCDSMRAPLSQCIDKDVFYKTPPPIVNILLRENSTRHIELLNHIAIRKERWARDLITSALTTTNILNSEQQQALLKSLPALARYKPSKQSMVTLRSMVEKNNNHQLTPYIVRFLLLYTPEDTFLYEYAKDQLTVSLLDNNEDHTMRYAEALYTVQPQTVIDMINRQGMSNENE